MGFHGFSTSMLAYPRVNHVEIKHFALVMMLPVTWHCLICSSTSWASDHCLGTFWMRRLFLGHQLANLLVEPPAVHPHPLFGITSSFCIGQSSTEERFPQPIPSPAKSHSHGTALEYRVEGHHILQSIKDHPAG